MQKSKKKIHKNMVKYIQQRNKALAADAYLGLNRFKIYLYSEEWNRFSDNSGYMVSLLFKLVDNRTGNTAYFKANNYNYERKIFEYANDFLIRCSSGTPGQYPLLHYIAYDVHEIVPYDGKANGKIFNEEGIVNTYSWLKNIQF